MRHGDGAVRERQIAARYSGRWLRGYVRGKLAHDPLYPAVTDELLHTPAPVLDVGCGVGLLLHCLRAAGGRHRYLGIEPDRRKLAQARYAARDLRDARFSARSAQSLPRWRGHVTILDMLHYLDRADQETLLIAAAERTAPGAMLVVRNTLRTSSWRFRCTRLEEGFLFATRWMRFPALHYPTVEELHAPLRVSGLEVTTRPLWGGTPFNGYLTVARHPEAPRS